MADIAVSFIVLKPEDGGRLLREPVGLLLQSGVTVGHALGRFTGLGATDIAGFFASRRVAVFGVTVQAGDCLHEGDRIEVLDDLHFDPMESRRRRARHKAEQPKSRRRQQVKTGE